MLLSPAAALDTSQPWENITLAGLSKSFSML